MFRTCYCVLTFSFLSEHSPCHHNEMASTSMFPWGSQCEFVSVCVPGRVCVYLCSVKGCVCPRCVGVFVFALQMLVLFPNLDISHSLGCTPGFLLVYEVGDRGALYLMEVILPCIWTALLIFQALPLCDLEAALGTRQCG